MSYSGPMPTIISVLRRATATMVDDLLTGLAAAGFGGFTAAHQSVFENLDRDGTRITDLATRARMTQQSMSELVATLEALGYVERAIDPADRRARLVRLTPLGQQAARHGIQLMIGIKTEWSQRLAAAGVSGDLVAAFTAVNEERDHAPIGTPAE